MPLFDAPSAINASTSRSRSVSSMSSGSAAPSASRDTIATAAASPGPARRIPATPPSSNASRSASAGSGDIDGEDDGRRGFLAHASGLSPTVTLNRIGSPPRRMAMSAMADRYQAECPQQRSHTREFSSFQPTITSLLPDAGGGHEDHRVDTHDHRADAIVGLTGCSPTPR